VKVFLSWSGTKSRAVAIAFRDWLPGVINSVEPFVSAKDIDPGVRWQAEVADQLKDTSYGIICVTRDNQSARWLNFEAGALAKAVESSRVVPLAVDLKPSDIEPPLGHFQAQEATEDGVSAIVRSINAACTPPLNDELLEKSFSKWWPDLDAQLKNIEQTTPAPPGDTRSERELLEETLDIVRGLARADTTSALWASWASLRDVETPDTTRIMIDPTLIAASLLEEQRRSAKARLDALRETASQGDEQSDDK
jgi:hypothetical protein